MSQMPEEFGQFAWDMARDIQNQPKYTDQQKIARNYLETRLGLDWYYNVDKVMKAGGDENPMVVAAASKALGSETPRPYNADLADLKADEVKAKIDELAKEQRDGLFDKVFGAVYDNTKGINRLAMAHMMAPGQALVNVQGLLLKTVLDEDNPLDGGLAGAQYLASLMAPQTWLGDTPTRERVLNTQAGVAWQRVAQDGWDAGWGVDAVGTGFVIDPDGEVYQKQEENTADFWTLANGDPYTLGRLTAEWVGLPEGSAAYGVGSGAVDFFNVLFNDPLNLIPAGPFAKAGSAAARASVVAARNLDDADIIARAITLLDEDAVIGFDSPTTMRLYLERVARDDPQAYKRIVGTLAEKVEELENDAAVLRAGEQLQELNAKSQQQQRSLKDLTGLADEAHRSTNSTAARKMELVRELKALEENFQGDLATGLLRSADDFIDEEFARRGITQEGVNSGAVSLEVVAEAETAARTAFRNQVINDPAMFDEFVRFVSGDSNITQARQAADEPLMARDGFFTNEQGGRAITEAEPPARVKATVAQKLDATGKISRSALVRMIRTQGLEETWAWMHTGRYDAVNNPRLLEEFGAPPPLRDTGKDWDLLPEEWLQYADGKDIAIPHYQGGRRGRSAARLAELEKEAYEGVERNVLEGMLDRQLVEFVNTNPGGRIPALRQQIADINTSLSDYRLAEQAAKDAIAAKQAELRAIAEEVKTARRESLSGRAATATRDELTQQREEILDLAKAELGILKDGSEVGSKQFLTSVGQGNLDGVAKSIVEINKTKNSFGFLRDMMPKMRAEDLLRISEATTVEEVLDAFVIAFQYGELRVASARQLSWIDRLGMTTERLLERAEDIPGHYLARRSALARYSNKPNQIDGDATKVDSMVNLVADSVAFAMDLPSKINRGRALEILDFRDEYMLRMAKARNAAERKAIYLQMWPEMFKRLMPEFKELPDDVQKATLDHFFNKIVKADEENAVANAAYIAEGGKSAHANRIAMEDRLNYLVTIPDVVGIRRAFGNAKATMDQLKRTGQLTETRRQMVLDSITNFLDRKFKPSLLVFRFAYLLLNVGFQQANLQVAGHSTLLNNPLGTVAFASRLNRGDTNGSIKFLNRFGPDGLDVKGNSLLNPVVEDEFQTILRSEMPQTAFGKIATYTLGGRLDAVNETYIADRFAQNLVQIRKRAVKPGDEEYIPAISERAVNFFHSDMNLDVLGFLLGGNKIPKKFIDMGEKRGVTPRRAMVDYYFKGPGKAILDEIESTNWYNANEAPVRYNGKDPDLPNFSTREGVEEYLFGDGPFSVAREVRALTGDLDPRVAELLERWARHTSDIRRAATEGGRIPDNLKTFEIPAGVLGTEPVVVKSSQFQVIHNAVGDLLKARWAETGNQRRPVAVLWEEPITTKQQTIEAVGNAVDGSYTWFYNWAGDKEWRFAMGMVFIENQWMAAAKRVFLLSKEDAETVLALARHELRGKKSRIAKQALKLMEENVQLANGRPEYSLDDIWGASLKEAYNKHYDQAFVATRRNDLAYKTRLAMPFVQPTLNPMRIFARNALRNPKSIYRSERFYQSMQATDSNAVYDAMGFDYDPDQGFIWTDDNGVQRFSVPLLGYVNQLFTSFSPLDPTIAAVKGVTGDLEGALGQFTDGVQAMPGGQTNMRMDTWNLINMGEFLPGLGAAVTIPYSLLLSYPGVEERIPEWFTEQVLPVRESRDGGDAEAWLGLIPGHVRQMFEAIPLFGQVSNEYWVRDVGPAMAALVQRNPEKYMSVDPDTGQMWLTREGQELLILDAEPLARSWQFGKAWNRMTFRGGQSASATIKGLDGELVPASVMWKEFEELEEATGSKGQALFTLMERYGDEVVFFFNSPSEYLPKADADGFKFVQANQQFALGVPNVLHYFYPKDEMTAASVAYSRWASKRGKGQYFTKNEIANNVNIVMARARKGAIDAALANGEITRGQATVLRAEVQESLEEFSGSTQQVEARYRNDLAQLRKAMEHPELAASPVGVSVGAYLNFYDEVTKFQEGDTLEGQSDAPLREDLRYFGERLCEENPEFCPVWDGLLSLEVTD